MNKIEDYIKEATSRLKSDIEIQVEVQQELRSHIEASIDDTHQGESAAEAEERALKEMGSAELIKDDLLEAHASSMQWKSRLFKVVQFIAVPVLILAMLWSLLSDSMVNLAVSKGFTNNSTEAVPEMSIDESIEKWKKEQTELSFYKVYSHPEWKSENIHLLKEEIEVAMQADTDNAWLDYAYVRCVVDFEIQDFDVSLDHENVREKYEELWNDSRVQKCLSLLVNAAEKNNYKSYASTMTHQLKDKMRNKMSSHTYVEYLMEAIKGASVSEAFAVMEFSNVLIYHLSTLDPNEDKDELIKYISTMGQMINMTGEENYLLTYAISMIMAESFRKEIEGSEKMNVLDENTKNQLNKLFAFSKQYKNRDSASAARAVSEEFKYYAVPADVVVQESVISFIPDTQYIHEKLNVKQNLDEWRRFTYSTIDRHIIQFTAFLISLTTLYFYMKILLSKKKSIYPHLKLNLGVKTLMLILGAIIGPIALFSMMYIVNEHGSRAWSQQLNAPYFILEIMTLIFTIVLLPIYIVSVKTSKRCEQIGVGSEKPSEVTKWMLMLLAMCWIYLVVSKPNYLSYETMWESWQNKIAMVFCFILTCLFAYKVCTALYSSVFKKKDDRTYSVTLARAKIVYAILPIMVCLFITNQGMKVNERRLIRQVAHVDSEEIILYIAEYEVCDYFKGKFDEIFSED